MANLKEKIRDIIEEKGEASRGKIATELQEEVSGVHISRLLGQLVREGSIIRIGKGRYTRYVSKKRISETTSEFHKRFKNEHLEEHIVLTNVRDQFPHIHHLNENVQSIFDYAFSEMVNNAIEHSGSKYIEVTVRKGIENIEFIVDDFGVGVFRNVMKKRGLNSELESMQDLLKGKTTTAPQAHSGEGIFFTSKVADVFALESFGYMLLIDNTIPDVFFQEHESAHRGTRVTFTLSRESSKHISDIFKEYQSNPGEYAFDKTKVKVSLYSLGTIHVSRSQARRILSGLEKFKTVILDFSGVPTIGQGFADEIFRVFQKKHPEITIEAVNTNEAVSFMVQRSMN